MNNIKIAMEKILKSSENILPCVLWILGILIVFKFNLEGYEIKTHTENTIFSVLLKWGDFKENIIRLESHVLFRLIFGVILSGIILMYYTRLSSMTFAISLFLIVHIVGYMSIVSSMMMMPSLTEICAYILMLIIWYFLFFVKRDITTLTSSCFLVIGLAIIDPVFAVSIISAIILSTVICAMINAQRDIYFYHLFLILLCGFIGGSFSLIVTGNIHNFLTLLITHYQKGVCMSMLLTLLTAIYYSPLEDFIPKSAGLMTKNFILILLTFSSAIVIGRLDYISHFS